MPTSVREAGAAKVAEFPVPIGGTWNSIAANMIPPNALYQSLNVFIRRGRLRSRPGMSLLNATQFNGVVIGGDMAVQPSGKVLIAITPTDLYTLRITDTIWQPVVTLAFAASNESLIDICFLETSGEYIGIIANGETVLKYWKDGVITADITPSVGTVPVAKSVCIAARRVVALVAPSTIRWTSTFDYTAWSDLNFNKIAQTNDEGICIRPLGTLDFVIYKERSIYIAKAQAGSDASAFSVRFIQQCEGPAGVHSVVNVDGMHMYMTSTGRIGIFDGSTLVNWIADGLWLYLQDDINPLYASKIFGVYDYRLHTVTFYYPRNNASTDEPVTGASAMSGMVVINLPLQNSGIGNYASFLGLCTQRPVSYGYEMRFDNRIPRAIVFTSPTGQRESFQLDESINTDDGLNFTCAFQTGLSPLPDMKHYAVSVESLFERGEGYGQVYLQGIKSDALETENDILLSYNNGIGIEDISDGQYIDLSVKQGQEYCGLMVTGRFVGLKYTWQSVSNVRFAGSILYGRLLA